MVLLGGCPCCSSPSVPKFNRCGYGCNYTWEIDLLSQSMGRCSDSGIPAEWQGEGFYRYGCDNTTYQPDHPQWATGTVLQSAVGYQGITSTATYPAYGSISYSFGYDDGETPGRYLNTAGKTWLRQGYTINPDDDPDGWVYKQFERSFYITPICIDSEYGDLGLCENTCGDPPATFTHYPARLAFRIWHFVAARITTATGVGAGSYDKWFYHPMLVLKQQSCDDIRIFGRVQNPVPCCGFLPGGCSGGSEPLPCVDVREFYFDDPTVIRMSVSGIQVETDPVYDYDWFEIYDYSFGDIPSLPPELTSTEEATISWTSTSCCCYDSETGESLSCNPLP